MLTLTIKKKWFDMILSGEKEEEYREITRYYRTRFMNAPRDSAYGSTFICFRNGYSKNSPMFIARVFIYEGYGKTKWGAEPNEKYYILKILEIVYVKE